MAAKKAKTFRAYRDSKTGKFVTVRDAKQRPRTTVSERIPKVGRGGTSPKTAKTLSSIKGRYSKSFERLAKK